jgi:hypothetical protein
MKTKKKVKKLYEIGAEVWITPIDGDPRAAKVVGYIDYPRVIPIVEFMGKTGTLVKNSFDYARICHYNDRPEHELFENG